MALVFLYIYMKSNNLNSIEIDYFASISLIFLITIFNFYKKKKTKIVFNVIYLIKNKAIRRHALKKNLYNLK